MTLSKNGPNGPLSPSELGSLLTVAMQERVLRAHREPGCQDVSVKQTLRIKNSGELPLILSYFEY